MASKRDETREGKSAAVSGDSPRASLLGWLYHVDRILRGDATQFVLTTTSQGAVDADIKIPIVGVSVVVILLGVIYGFCMGIFSLIYGAENSEYARAFMQTFASMVKVPLLFGLTLVITFPSLYVFNALIGSRLKIGAVLKLLVSSLAVNLAVLASMGPILAFFSASTPNYSFIVLLNVALFALAGCLGLAFLLQTLTRMANVVESAAISAPQSYAESARLSANSPENSPVGRSGAIAANESLAADFQDAQPQEDVRIVSASLAPEVVPSPLDSSVAVQRSQHVRNVFACWLFVFGLVGAQMGWILRPFIGSPNMPFQWFRPRDSNFFEAVNQSFWNLF